jgi:hypothetical protein
MGRQAEPKPRGAIAARLWGGLVSGMMVFSILRAIAGIWWANYWNLLGFRI